MTGDFDRGHSADFEHQGRAALFQLDLQRRGELVLLRTARALAAYDGETAVTRAHLRRLAAPALSHRLRRDPLDESGSATRIERTMSEPFGAFSTAAE